MCSVAPINRYESNVLCSTNFVRQASVFFLEPSVCQLRIAHILRAELTLRKGSDGGTDVVVLNECCEWMAELIVDHLQNPEEAPVFFVDLDPVIAWITVLPMKEIVVLLDPEMDSSVIVTEEAISVPDSVWHGVG